METITVLIFDWYIVFIALVFTEGKAFISLYMYMYYNQLFVFHCITMYNYFHYYNVMENVIVNKTCLLM